MLIAVVATLFDKNVLTFEYIVAGIVVGSVIGAVLAIKIEMTAMPQLVAVFNGFGGGASVLVAGAAYLEAMGSLPQGGLLGKAASALGANPARTTRCWWPRRPRASSAR